MEKEYGDMKSSQLEMMQMMKNMESQLAQIKQSVHYIKDRFSELEVKLQDKKEPSSLIFDPSKKLDSDSKMSPENSLRQEKVSLNHFVNRILIPLIHLF